ncbi:hypothetical protein ElyMa_005794500 [Elysia marginata]|uniref:Uncharacterized protein n=1 Tax=Elysia marginata TaxID=1093978 RepID=A0AAV4FRP2_9GAST|nr:hypothetical protein ElyMa_005794500 [Elysia marginata]
MALHYFNLRRTVPGTQARTSAAAANRPSAKPRPSVSGPISAYGSPRSSLPEYPPRFSSQPGSRRPSTNQRFIPNTPLTNDQATISHVYRPLTRQQRSSIFKGSRAGTRTSRRPTLSEADTFWPLQRTLSNLSLSPLTRSAESDDRPASPFRPIEKTPQGVVRPFTSDKPPATRKPSTSFLSASPIPLPNITPDSAVRSKSESKKPVQKSQSPLPGHSLDAERPPIPAIPLSNGNSVAASPVPSKSQVSTYREEPLPDIDVRPPSRPIPPFSIKSVRPPPSKVLINIHPPIKQQDSAKSRPASSASTADDSLESVEEEEPDDTIESITNFDSPYTKDQWKAVNIIYLKRSKSDSTARTSNQFCCMGLKNRKATHGLLTSPSFRHPLHPCEPISTACASWSRDLSQPISTARASWSRDLPQPTSTARIARS